MRFLDRYLSEIIVGFCVLMIIGSVYVALNDEHGEQRRDLSIQECITFCDKRGVYSWEREAAETHTTYVNGKPMTYTTTSPLCECMQEAQ